MRNRDFEEIQGLFQTWPLAFKERFRRSLTKAELLDELYLRKTELEKIAVRSKFSDYNIPDLDLAIEYLETMENEHILDEVKKPNIFNGIRSKKLGKL